MKVTTNLAVLAAIGFAGAALAGEYGEYGTESKTKTKTAAADTATATETLLVSEMRGTNIQSSDGENIGSVQDFVVDESGQITHAVVSYGGTLGIGGQQTLVPYDVMSASMQGEQIVLERSKLEGAPVIRNEELTAGTAWRTQVDQHWGHDSGMTASGETSGETMRTAEAEDAGMQTEADAQAEADVQSEPDPGMGTQESVSSQIEEDAEATTERPQN